MYERSCGNVKVELDLFNYPKKADLKGVAGVDTSNLASKSDLASLKAEVDEIDIEELQTSLADLSKLSNIVDNDVVKKTVCDEIVTKVNAIDTSRFVLKTQYNTDKSGLENKIDVADKQIIMLRSLRLKVKYLVLLAYLLLLLLIQFKIRCLTLVT